MKKDSSKLKDKLDPLNSPSLKSWGDSPSALPKKDVVIECGWGRLIFAHTFARNTPIADILKDEKKGYRDLALYLRDPHVVVAKAPQELFIDPSYTYRLWLDEYKPDKSETKSFSIREINPKTDISEINRIYRSRNMVTISEDFLTGAYEGKFIKYWIVADNNTKKPIATAMSIDHKKAFGDPENGSSLWSLAVDQQAKYPGVGTSLIKHIASFYKEQGRSFIDVSVFHDNTEAITIYEKLGFQQVPAFCVKNKNAINEKLFTGPQPEEELNPYAGIIVNEARKRGIKVQVLDPVDNYFQLTYGGRTIVCRESLSELTSSIAMSRCADKQTTHRLLKNAGLKVPAQQAANSPAQNQAFLKKYGTVVVKPAVGEQGAGITVDIKTKNELTSALEYAKKVSDKIILEEMVPGSDLRVIVIGFEVVAAAIRKPPAIIGDGKHSIIELIKAQSRRREQATQGESSIPMDEELERTVYNAGHTLDDILLSGKELVVRKTANLHTGGTIHDVTEALNPEIAEAARQAARAIDIPVTGLDFIVGDITKTGYVIIEANERPGLANHEPQPTAEKFIDLLFPQSVTR